MINWGLILLISIVFTNNLNYEEGFWTPGTALLLQQVYTSILKLQNNNWKFLMQFLTFKIDVSLSEINIHHHANVNLTI